MKHSEAFEKLVASIKPHIKEVSIDTLLIKRQTNQPLNLLDVREDHEWDSGYIEEAVHLGRGILERDIEKYFPDKTIPLILYCGGGYRSALACYSLQQMGYSNVQSLSGGFRAWCQKQLPIHKSPFSRA
jgi:rhodanese-related sulfurtransferase